MDAALEKALLIYGSQNALAKAIGYSQHAVWHACKKGRVSPGMAVAIERATNAVVLRGDLRPDIFGDA